MSILSRIKPYGSTSTTSYWHRQVSIWPLITFRVTLGLVIAFGALRFVMEGWVDELLIQPEFFFDFYGFGGLPRPSALGAYGLYSLVIASALAVVVGYRFRWATGLLLLSFTYAELLDATNYLNHYYLVVLLVGLLWCTPAHQQLSLDVRAGRVQASSTSPAWCRDALLFQLALVYVCAGVAKVNADWLLRAMPLAIWLPEHADLPLIGSWLAEPWVAFAGSWAACLYDLTIVGWLLWGRTRRWAYVAVLVFHGATWALFNIGLFPLIMSTSTLLFFSGAQHEWVWIKLRRKICPTPAHSWQPVPGATSSNATRRWVPYLLGGYFVVQLMLPARALAYPGSVAWSEEGYRFGWRVMLVEKAGTASFGVSDKKSGRTVLVDPLDHLTPYQTKQMAIQPDFIWQFAQYLGQQFEQEHGFLEPQVTVESWVSLNGRRARPLISPSVDLLSVHNGLSPKPWILPYE